MSKIVYEGKWNLLDQYLANNKEMRDRMLEIAAEQVAPAIGKRWIHQYSGDVIVLPHFTYKAFDVNYYALCVYKGEHGHLFITGCTTGKGGLVKDIVSTPIRDLPMYDMVNVIDRCLCIVKSQGDEVYKNSIIPRLAYVFPKKID